MKKNYKFELMEIVFSLKTTVNSMLLSLWGIKKFSGKLLLSILCVAFSVGVSAQDTQAPANPNTNRSARIVLNYFRTLKNQAAGSAHHLVSGQFIGYNDVNTPGYAKITTIFNNTGQGKYVGIVGGDYASQPNSNPANYTINYDLTNPRFITAWNAGHFVSLQVHFKTPIAGGDYKTILTNAQYTEVITPGTTLYNNWRAQLSTVADGLEELQNAGVVVIFRPFHEMNGSWFWWGGYAAITNGNYKTLWQQTFNYLTIDRGLNNLLFLFAASAKSDLVTSTYYPGDNYVDLTGLDTYTSNVTTGGIGGVAAMLGIDKPLGLAEYGPISSTNPVAPLTYQYTTLTNGMKADANLKKMCYFSCWNANWGMDVNPAAGVTAALNDTYVANRDNIVKVADFKPANANANIKAQGVLSYIDGLRARTDKYLISGQFMGYSDGPGYQKIIDIYNNNAANKYVGIVGSDYSNTNLTAFNSTTYTATNNVLHTAWDAGHIVTLQVSMPNPKYPTSYTAAHFAEKISLLDVLPGGAYHANWIAELNVIAAGLQVLKDNNVMVLFRPFHKMNAVGKVWYNNTNTQYFKDTWKFMFNYLTYTKGLNNLLWVFSPDMNTDAATYYPGDEYVDITSLNVDVAKVTPFTSADIPGYDAMIALGKSFGITEFRPLPNTAINYNYHDWFINSLKTAGNNLRDVSFFMCMDGNSGMNYNVKVYEALNLNACVVNMNNFPNLKSATINNPENITKIGDYSTFGDIKVYPNPIEKGSSMNLRIDGLTNNEEMKVSVFNIVGNVVLQQTLRGSLSGSYELKKVSSLQQGIYILSVESLTKSANLRFVVN